MSQHTRAARQGAPNAGREARIDASLEPAQAASAAAKLTTLIERHRVVIGLTMIGVGIAVLLERQGGWPISSALFSAAWWLPFAIWGMVGCAGRRGRCR